MSEKGFLNVAFFLTDFLFDTIWLLLRTVLSPVFLIAWFIIDDKPVDQYEWWPN